MFTLMIHALEVLAMYPNGLTTVDKIVEMGCEYTHKQVVSALRSLEKDGYVTSVGKGKSREWQITEKAIEHCEHVTRAYSKSDWTRETPQEVKTVQSPDYSIKMLVNRAKRRMIKDKVSAHIALEETVSAWKTARVHTVAVNYYSDCSETELESLITEVVKAAAQMAGSSVLGALDKGGYSAEWNVPFTEWKPEFGCQMCSDPVVEGHDLCSACLWGV